MLRGQKKIDANLAKISRAEDNIVKWQNEIKETHDRMGTPKYMANPFQAHLERLPQDVLHTKALRQYDLDQINFYDDAELIEAMVSAEFQIDSTTLAPIED